MGIKGETVFLVEKLKTGTDPFGKDIFSETEIPVENVLIGSPSTEGAVDEMNINGKRIAYVLGIPKDDTHNWKDSVVRIRGEKFRTYGSPLTQTPENVPGKWNTQVKVERYG